MDHDSQQDELMRDKVCLVTGATAGIGKATVGSLVRMGAELIIVGRNEQKVQQVSTWLQGERSSAVIHILCADFEDLDQVRKLVDAIDSLHRPVDVLINNAGAFFNTRQSTSYGVEKTFLVNHLAPFLLTTGLLERGALSDAARVIIVSSDGHRMGSIDFDDLEYHRGYFGMKGYARSKLANLLFAYELDRKLRDSRITVNAVHPGHTATDIWRTNFGVVGPGLKWVMSLFARTPEEGADTVIYVATDPSLEGVSGKYFADRQVINSSPDSYDKTLASKLWEVSELLVGHEG
jgi:NAD(P)-dependent dehydrogenase (short-subunit alcohol dehydrogenase family)